MADSGNRIYVHDGTTGSWTQDLVWQGIDAPFEGNRSYTGVQWKGREWRKVYIEIDNRVSTVNSHIGLICH
jgi:hypothetical protein